MHLDNDWTSRRYARVVVALDHALPGCVAPLLETLATVGAWGDLNAIAIENTAVDLDVAFGEQQDDAEDAVHLTPRAQALHDAVVATFTHQLDADQAAMAAGTKPSQCAVGAPRMRSKTDRCCRLARAIARKLYDYDRLAEECLTAFRASATARADVDPLQPVKRKVYKRYARLLSALARALKAAAGGGARAKASAGQQRTDTLLASVNDERWRELAARHTARSVTHPEPVPVTPCTADELEPLLVHLRSNLPAPEDLPFTKGACVCVAVCIAVALCTAIAVAVAVAVVCGCGYGCGCGCGCVCSVCV